MSEQSLSVQKAMTVLRVVGSAQGPISPGEVISRSGLGKTIVLRILATMLAERMIDREPETGRYILGPSLILLAQKALTRNPLIVRATPVLEEIVALTNDAGLLMVINGRESLCVDKRTGTTPIRNVGTEIGTRSPLHAGGGPFALLAFSDDAFIHEYLSGPISRPTANTVVDPAAIWGRIHEARERGFTIGREDLFEYIVAVGVPIRDDGGRLLGCLSIGGIAARYPPERCLQVGDALKNLLVKILNQPNTRE